MLNLELTQGQRVRVASNIRLCSRDRAVYHILQFRRLSFVSFDMKASAIQEKSVY